MMPSSGDDVSGKSRLQNVIFFTGLALYVLSFFLPVFKDTVGSKSISGWRCAYRFLNPDYSVFDRGCVALNEDNLSIAYSPSLE
jgi:hypothetical protein